MHEMAITQSVIQAIGERMGDAPVQRVCLEIGTLSGVVADSVRFCFEVVTAVPRLEGASVGDHPTDRSGSLPGLRHGVRAERPTGALRVRQREP